MHDYILSCCSTADLSRTWLANYDINYIYFNYELGGTWYKDDFGLSNSPKRLYDRMLDGEECKTSQVSVGDYLEYFESFLSQGKDVLHVTLSSGISGTYNSACAARDQLAPKYPGRKLYVVDSLAASSGYGLLMIKLAEKRDEGLSITQLRDWAVEHRLELNHWFISTDLTFFVRGGRISRAAGLVGGALRVCPLMNVAADGSLAVVERIRTERKSLRRQLAEMKARAFDGTNYSDRVFISNSECQDSAHDLSNMIERDFPNINGHVEHFPIGATIGVHTGPGTVALFFWGKPREE